MKVGRGWRDIQCLAGQPWTTGDCTGWSRPGQTTYEEPKLDDYEVILGDMQFRQMCEEVSTRAPMLHGLLSGLITPKIKKQIEHHEILPNSTIGIINHYIDSLPLSSLGTKQQVSLYLWCLFALQWCETTHSGYISLIQVLRRLQRRL